MMGVGAFHISGCNRLTTSDGTGILAHSLARSGIGLRRTTTENRTDYILSLAGFLSPESDFIRRAINYT